MEANLLEFVVAEANPSLRKEPAEMDRTARIIVLDDEAELRNMLQRFLTSQGFSVRVVENSERLARYLHREPFDLLVLDLMIGDENGLEICARLRAVRIAPGARLFTGFGGMKAVGL